MNRDDTVAVQRLLRALGRPVAVDGIFGPVTRAAVSAALRAATVPPPLVSAIDWQLRATRPIWGIVVHCTAGFSPSTAAGIRKMHMTPGWMGSPKGWADIGYHMVVRLDGSIEAGRPEAKVGAHVIEQNVGTLGVVYVGGVDGAGKPKDTRTPMQADALTAVCRAWIAKYPTIEWVKGHNDFTDAKACPSFRVGSDPLDALV